MNVTITEAGKLITTLSEAREFGMAVRNNMDWCMANIALEYSEEPGVQEDYRKKLGQTFKAIKEFLDNCPVASEYPDHTTMPALAQSTLYKSLLDDLSILNTCITESQFLLVKQTSFIADKIAGREVREIRQEEEGQ